MNPKTNEARLEYIKKLEENIQELEQEIQRHESIWREMRCRLDKAVAMSELVYRNSAYSSSVSKIMKQLKESVESFITAALGDKK
ncbi:MAG: hypothetical protein IJW72_00335 [Alphaproteobacteria bacterium]|nr:hypothetical protein [Alphaproteobacteria bacterium]MBQ7284689.1 hypothetical protein [Alphaproteobacteria bacterium]